MRKSVVVVFAIFHFGLFQIAIATDAIDRLKAARLEAVHRAVLKLKAERKELPQSGPFRDYRANLHVHSAFSHDSRGKIEEIVAAAKAAGTSVLMFTEHPAKHYDVFIDGHKGLRNGVLLIPGAETNGMLIYPRQSIKEIEGAKPQEMSDFVRNRDGLTFVSHLEERMDWELSGITGVEIYNTHADVKDEKRLIASMRNPLWLMGVSESVRKYPQESFSALGDYPADYLKRWDELCKKVPHTGISANDSHQNQGVSVRLADDGKVQILDGVDEKVLELEATAFNAIKPIPENAKSGDVLFELKLDRYEYSLRYVGTHLLLTELTEPAVWEALNSGRAFVAFDWIADATGFDLAVSDGKTRHEMGSLLKYSDGLKLTGQAPLPGHWKLIRNGKPIYETEGSSIEFSIKEPGNYRAELWLKVADEDRIWVLSNPFYIGDK